MLSSCFRILCLAPGARWSWSNTEQLRHRKIRFGLSAVGSTVRSHIRFFRFTPLFNLLTLYLKNRFFLSELSEVRIAESVAGQRPWVQRDGESVIWRKTWISGGLGLLILLQKIGAAGEFYIYEISLQCRIFSDINHANISFKSVRTADTFWTKIVGSKSFLNNIIKCLIRVKTIFFFTDIFVIKLCER